LTTQPTLLNLRRHENIIGNRGDEEKVFSSRRERVRSREQE